MEYIFFEDEKWQNFLPFTYTRFTGDLRAGACKLRQRLNLYFNSKNTKILIRNELVELYKERHHNWSINKYSKGNYTLINTRMKPIFTVKDQINKMKYNDVFMYNNDVVAIRLKFNEDFELNYNSIKELINGLNIYQITSNEPLYEYTWDLINDNEELINIDYQQIFKDDDNFCEIEPGVVSLNPYDIWIGENAKLGQNVILDATEGPVIIDENAHIMHNSVIMGPVYIGKNAIIKIGAKIYQNTSIGPFCKIGGEVSNTIIQGYTNKQHDGFLGGSYIGEWVNIGADTNNSDLKNTYKPVKVWCYSKNKKIDTNNIFIGCFIGDHSKIGINCSINTGTIIGFGTNLYGSELIKDYIPSFSWGTANNLKTYKMTKFLETAEIVKIRRNKNLSKTEIKIIKKIQDKHFINK